MPVKSYWWWDTPDGEDLVKKTDFAARCGLVGGLPMGCVYAMYQPQRDLQTMLFRYARIAIPACGMGVAFAVTTQLLCKHVPKMDHRISYFIGGVAAGSVAGGAAKSPLGGAIVGLYLGVAAAWTRDVHEDKDAPFCLGPREMPRVQNNDDTFFAADYRGQPKMSLPPPAARPAIAPSELHSYF